MIFIILYEYKRKSPVLFLWATLFIMFGITHLFTVLISGYDYADYVLIEASSFVIMFMLIYFVTRFIIIQKSRNVEILVYYREESDSNYKLFLLFLIISIGLKLYKYLRFAGSIFSTSWGLGREYTATLDYFNSNQILSVIFYLSSGILLYCIVTKKVMPTILTASLIAFQVLVTRNRIEVLPLLIPFITFYILTHRRLKIRQMFILLVFGLVAIYLIYALRAFRHYGSIESFLSEFSPIGFHERVMNLFRNEDGELSLRRDFYFFLLNDNKFKNFGKGHSYLRMLLVFIPTRWSLGLKPPDFAISMGAAVGMGSGGSTHPTLFGDCFANLGWWGTLLGGFWAIFASVFDTIILRQRKYLTQILLFNLYAVSFVIMGRGSVYNGYVTMFYGTVLLVLWNGISRMVKQNRLKRINRQC